MKDESNNENEHFKSRWYFAIKLFQPSQKNLEYPKGRAIRSNVGGVCLGVKAEMAKAVKVNSQKCLMEYNCFLCYPKGYFQIADLTPLSSLLEHFNDSYLSNYAQFPGNFVPCWLSSTFQLVLQGHLLNTVCCRNRFKTIGGHR